jgi:hypothetical protein
MYCIFNENSNIDSSRIMFHSYVEVWMLVRHTLKNILYYIYILVYELALGKKDTQKTHTKKQQQTNKANIKTNKK